MSSNTTIIDHKLRIEFNLSMIEYCVIKEIENNMVNEWYFLNVKEMMKKFDISRATVYNSLASLQEKDLLNKNKKNDKLYTTTLLYKKFFV